MGGMTPDPARLHVDIWSDIACPWCYIGKRRFEAALAGFAHREAVEVVWHSFELDLQAPATSPIPMRDVLAQKYGVTPEKAQGMMDQMTEVAAGDGLEYHFEKLRPTNTFLAHQLLHLAGEHGLQDAMKERLLRAYLSEGELLGDPQTLARLAGEVGLDPAGAEQALAEGRYAPAVRGDEARARAYGIQGVPFFVIGGKYGVSGAQPPEVLLGALEQTWSETRPLTLLTPATATEGCEDGQCAVPTSPQESAQG